jgi:YhcG PDDEXK nuclease domain
LLFFHRGLNCLVAIELKVGRFEPEYLGKLAFCLEALDRDIKKPHEQAAIGVLLCASKDEEVVEYALSRSLQARVKTAQPCWNAAAVRNLRFRPTSYFGVPS